MARFIGTVQGNKGEAHRLGHKKGGIVAHVASWTGGVEVQVYVDDNDQDRVRVTQTRGSKNRTSVKILYEGPLDPSD